MTKKKKLTVMVSKELVPRAKDYARQNGVSLSELIERSLTEVTSPPKMSFSQRWRGKFRPADDENELVRELAKKHL